MGKNRPKRDKRPHGWEELEEQLSFIGLLGMLVCVHYGKKKMLERADNSSFGEKEQVIFVTDKHTQAKTEPSSLLVEVIIEEFR